MEELKAVLFEIREEQKTQKAAIDELRQEIIQKIDTTMSTKMQEISEKQNEIEVKLENQEKRIENLEKQIRKRNVVFFGIEEKESNYFQLKDNILNIINQDIQVPCSGPEIQEIYRIGKKGTKCRPIVIKLATFDKKLNILKKCKYLKTSFTVTEDYPKSVQEKRKELHEIVRKERKEGKSVVLKYDKLIYYNNKDFTAKGPSENSSLKSPEMSESSRGVGYKKAKSSANRPVNTQQSKDGKTNYKRVLTSPGVSRDIQIDKKTKTGPTIQQYFSQRKTNASSRTLQDNYDTE